MRLEDKVAIITGAGRGIGRTTAIQFAKEGAAVIVADLDLDTTQAVVAEIDVFGGRAYPVQVNVAESRSAEDMVQSALTQFGRVDILVNNAGIVRDAQLYKMTEDQFDMVISVNLKGVYNCAKAVMPVMLERKSGVILNAASVVAEYGNFGQTNYVASKAGVVGMTKVWARELGRRGIRVNAVAPGFIETRMTEGIPEEVIDQIVSRVPLSRMGRPEDIANAYVWLASDEASYVHGHILAVDGGTTL